VAGEPWVGERPGDAHSSPDDLTVGLGQKVGDVPPPRGGGSDGGLASSDAPPRTARRRSGVLEVDDVRISGAIRLLGLAVAVMGCGPAAAGAHQSHAAAFGVSATPAALPSAGVMAVTPTAGPVGTTVTVRGRDCGNPASPTSVHVYFGNDGEPDLTGSVGAADLGAVSADSIGGFLLTFTIPASFLPFQGRGGGLVRPGTYNFATEPPLCLAGFVVLPTTGKG